jgi:homoprotocatechuate degradation regulator HpaR
MPRKPPLFHQTARSLPIALLRARESVMAPFRVMLARSGISEQKWRVLRALDEVGPMEQTALARVSCLLLPSLTRMLRTMEDEGLIVRATDQNDRRKSLVSITRSGRKLLISHAQASAEIFAELESRFGAERVEQLLDLLEELTDLPRPQPGNRD